MVDSIEVLQQISIREAGFDEYWLQDQIVQNPISLGLGMINVVQKERKQSSGGRLDLLMKDSEDDSMYEVEIMLGETDESHIIRTIEYWDNEKRRWPQRQHFAVLVAERINKRFFNVIHLLSYSIPIIAVQVSLFKVQGQNKICFTKILDTYEEIEDGIAGDVVCNREYWTKQAKWTVETADNLLSVVTGVFSNASLRYVQQYIAISVSGSNYLWLEKRGAPKSKIGFRIADSLEVELSELLDSKNISYVQNKRKFYYITVDKEAIERNRDTFVSLATLIKRAKQEDFGLNCLPD